MGAASSTDGKDRGDVTTGAPSEGDGSRIGSASLRAVDMDSGA